MKNYEPSVVVQAIVDKHESVLKDLDEEIIIDTSAASNSLLPPGVLLSSEGTRFQQTTVGGVFCQMIKVFKLIKIKINYLNLSWN